MRRSRRRELSAVAVSLMVALAVGAGALAAGRVPILAGPWAPNQKGYGHVKPRTIFNGGDPIGLVKNIHWASWGGPHAVGWGTGFWVGPRQFVFEGHFEKGAKIVLFHLGRCHGRPAYDAIEWFWPRHGQHFRRDTYINPCNGTYHH